MYSAIIRKLRPLLGSRLNMLGAVAALTLILAGAALAAHPKAGSKYAGFTSAPKVNGFRAPVSFKVSSSGNKLLSFKYGNTGCPSMTTPPGNPYLKSNSITTVGTIHVSSTGTFSIKNLKTTSTSNKTTFFTISSVTGKFKTAKTATGRIKFSNGFNAPGFTHSCETFTVTFTATTK
jgi:hypothetical protein